MMYQFNTYIDPFILPPKVDPKLPTRGFFQITFLQPKFILQTPKKYQIRYKLWGEQQHRYITHTTPTQFSIKCNNSNFATYLRDMRFLKIQIVDSRNTSLIGTTIINLMLYVNAEPMFNESDCPFLPMKEIFDIVKNNSIKSKIGQIEVQIKCQFKLRPVTNFTSRVLKQQKKLGTSSKQFNLEHEVQIPEAMRSISFKKQMQMIHQDLNRIQKSPGLDYVSGGIGHASKELVNDHQQILYRKRNAGIKLIKEQRVGSCHVEHKLRYQSVNVQAQLAKLKLDANQLLKTTPNSNSISYTLNLKIIKAIFNTAQHLILTLEYPVKYGYKKNKVVSLEVSPQSINKNQVRFYKDISIPKIEEDQECHIKFLFKNIKKQLIATSECVFDTLGQKEFKLAIKNKNQKQIGKLLLQIGDEQTQSQKISPSNNLTPSQINQKHKPVTSSENNNKHLVNLMIMIDIIKASLIDQQQDESLFYKVNFKFQKQIYETSLLKKKHWNFILTTSINTKINIQSPFLIFELWGFGINNKLIGIAKFPTQDLINLAKSGVVEANLQPVLLYDSNLQIENISRRENIGFMKIRITVGTPKQISKVIQFHSNANTPLQNLNSNQIPTNTQSSPANLTERDHISSSKRQQSKSKSSSGQNQGMSSRPSQINLQNTKNQILQIHNLMETITNFFHSISDTKQRIELILKQINLSQDMKLNEFQKVLQNILQNYEEYWDALTFFYGEGEYFNTLQFLKSFSSFVNFKDILIEELTSLLQQLNSQLTKQSVSLDVIQNKFTQFSQFGYISNQNFRQLLRFYKIDPYLIDRVLETYASTKENQLMVSQFINHLKCTKFSRPIEALSYNLTNLQHLIQNSVIDVINAEAQGVAIITNTLMNKNMDFKNICQLLQSLSVDVSIWQALLLIQSIKIFFKQDLDLVEGVISSKVMLSWLKSVINIHQVARPESLINPTQPDIVVLRTQRTETNPDDIANIASLLKQKDKFEYDDSSLPKRQTSQAHSNRQSKILEESKPLADIGHSSERYDTHQSQHIPYSSPSIRQSTQKIKIQELKAPNFKYLKCKVSQIKLDIDFNYLTLDILFLSLHQIFAKKQKGLLKFYSPSSFYTKVDINNLSLYKSKSEGFSITSKSFLNQKQSICKGFISFESIFKLENEAKKICILYNSEMKIVGRIIFEFSYIDKQQETEIIQKQFLFLRVLKMNTNSSFEGKCSIDFLLNGKAKINKLEIKKQYQVELDNKMFQASACFRIANEDLVLNAQFSIQNLFTSKMVKMEVPLLKQNNQYQGLLEIEVSIKQQEEIMTKIQYQTNSKINAFVFLDSLTYIGNRRQFNIFFSVSNQFSNSCPIYQKIQTQQPFSHLHLDQLHCVQNIKNQQEFIIKVIDGNSNLQIGNAKFALFLDTKKQFTYIGTSEIMLQNKFNIPLSLAIRVLLVERTEEVKIRNIIQKMRRDRLEKIVSSLDNQETNTIRNSLRQQKITLSEIQYFMQFLKQQEKYDKQKTLQSIFKKQENQKSRQEAMKLYSEFQYHDPLHTGTIEQQNLNRILQSLHLQKIDQQNQILDKNTKKKALVSYMPYLHYVNVLSPSYFEQALVQVQKTKESSPSPINTNQKQYVIPPQDDFKRICTQINKLHEILTKARQQ